MAPLALSFLIRYTAKEVKAIMKEVDLNSDGALAWCRLRMRIALLKEGFLLGPLEYNMHFRGK